MRIKSGMSHYINNTTIHTSSITYASQLSHHYELLYISINFESFDVLLCAIDIEKANNKNY